MSKDRYYAFTDMIREGDIARTTLYKLIKSGVIRTKVNGVHKTYSYKDVINNKPRKKK